MIKTIAVDCRFQDLMAELQERGYKVIDLHSGEAGANACIYHDGIRDYHNMYNLQDTGVLMIDGKGKTVNDIEAILQKGVYSSLF